jgi:hypothetical protein
MNNRPDPKKLPGFYRHAPDTSFAAAVSMIDGAATRETLALDYVRAAGPNGATANEVAFGLGWECYSSRPRLATLHKRGAIADSGLRRLGTTGRRQAVWVAPEYVSPPPAKEWTGDLFGVAT